MCYWAGACTIKLQVGWTDQQRGTKMKQTRLLIVDDVPEVRQELGLLLPLVLLGGGLVLYYVLASNRTR